MSRHAPCAAWCLCAALLGAAACEHAGPGDVAPPTDAGLELTADALMGAA